MEEITLPDTSAQFPCYLLEGIQIDIDGLKINFKYGTNRFPGLTDLLISDMRRHIAMLEDYLKATGQPLLTEKIKQDADHSHAIRTDS